MPDSDRAAAHMASAFDVLIVGAGPIGLACAIEVKRAGLSAVLVDKGSLVNSLLGYPTGMEFFSTPSLLELGGHPLATARYKPVREEVIDYYIGVATKEDLLIRLNEKVLAVDGDAGDFAVSTSSGTYRARAVIIATGFFDQPNRLDVPGEDLPHVSHYFKEAFPYSGQRVTIVGGKNSAAKAALSCVRAQARVSIVHRGEDIGTSVKYWIRPDLMNRIADGTIQAFFGANVLEITPTDVIVRRSGRTEALPTDWVIALTGYHPDFAFLKSAGIKLEGDELSPALDATTMESNRPGIYLAGTVCGGRNTSRWFIENGRIHAAMIAAHLTGAPAPQIEPQGQP